MKKKRNSFIAEKLKKNIKHALEVEDTQEAIIELEKLKERKED